MHSPLSDILRLVFFAAILIGPMAATGLKLETATGQSQENRTLAEAPPLSLLFTQPSAYIAGARVAFSEHFPCRELLIRIGNRLRLAVFGESPVPGVIVGRDGWLFYSKDDALDDYLNVLPFPEVTQDAIVRILTKRRDWLSARGIAFYVVVIPEKHSIYPEYMPQGFRPLRPRSRLDILYERLRSAGVEIVDVRPDLLRAKTVRQAYWKTDTHWNDWSAFLAAGRIVDVLRQRFPSVPPLRQDDYLIEEVEHRGGDLANMLFMSDTLRDRGIYMRPAGSQSPGRGVRFGSVRAYPDPAILPFQAMVVAETGDLSLPKLLVFRDSFFNAMIPFLSGHFQSAVFVWGHRFYPDIVAAEKPDIVVMEMVERYLSEFLKEDPLETVNP